MQRRDDPRDRRRTLLALTPRGREIDVDEGSAIDSTGARVLASGAPSEIEATRSVLARLATALEAHTGTLAARAVAETSGPGT